MNGIGGLRGGQISPSASGQQPGDDKNKWLRLLQTFLLYLAIFLLGIFILGQLSDEIPILNGQQTPEIPVTQVIQEVKEGNIEKITVNSQKLTVKFKDGGEARSRKDTPTQSLITLFKEAGIDNPAEKVTISSEESFLDSFGGSVVGNVVSIFAFIAVFMLISRAVSQSAMGEVFDIGKSSAKLFSRDGNENDKTTFDDAAGVREAKQELREVVDFLKNPQKYRKLGARIPRGVLLVGPAGVGKTLLAKAVANEAEVPFYSMAGSEFIEMLVGVGASRVRDLFSQAKKSAPALIFIDEIETVGKQRGSIAYMSHGEQEQTLNQILTEMDGFAPSDQVIVIAATNRPDILDPALTRPGRFDRRITLQLPDIEGRKGIIEIHKKNKPLADDVNLEQIAQRTVGFSGADIENMLNEAAIMAAREGNDEITRANLEEAATKVKLGPEKRRLQSEEDKKITAYHEAGHALVAARMENVDPVHRVSIVSRGFALGFTQIVPEQDRFHHTKTRLTERLAVMLGGRAAEELIFNDMTVGAGNDLERANLLVKKMVTEFGMSELGPLSFKYRDEEATWEGRLSMGQSKYSEKMAARIDEEIEKIIDGAYAVSQKVLKENHEVLDKLAERLVEIETIEQEELGRIMSGDQE